MSVASNLPDWPEPVLAGLLEKHVSLTRLSHSQKKQVWLHIQKNNPALADLLSSISTDGNIQDFIKHFGAEIQVSETEVPQQIIKELACSNLSYEDDNAMAAHSTFSP